MTPLLLRKKSILFVLALLFVVILAWIFINHDVKLPENNTYSPPFDFNISTSNSSCLLKQGATVQITIFVTKINGTAQTVDLNSDAYESGISCNFNPSTGKGNFSSIATITVWNSTTSNSYKINFTATSNTKSHNLPYNIDVLNSKVQVSLKAVFSVGFGPPTTLLSSITFIDSKTNETISVRSQDGIHCESTLENQHSYEVKIDWGFYPLGPNAFGHHPQKVGSYNSSIYVNAKVGEDSIVQDFLVPISYPKT
jgi:hypothetical protein